MTAREKRLAYMREYNKTYKRKRPHKRGDPEKYREYNREYCARYYRKRRAENIEAFRAEYAANARRWRAENPEAAKAKDSRSRKASVEWRQSYQQRLEVKIARNVRNRVWYAVKRGCKAGSAVRDLGCSVEFFKEHIAGMFQAGMSWDNYGKWHLDHIVPISSFDLQDREHFLKACHYTNYQPLWSIDNLRKGAKNQPGIGTQGIGGPMQQQRPAA